MQLVSQASGQPGPEGENGAQFSAGEALTLQVESKSDVTVRAYVQPRGPGEITFDQTQTFPQGVGYFPVGAFKPGPYVIRVIVDDTLVKSLVLVVNKNLAPWPIVS